MKAPRFRIEEHYDGRFHVYDMRGVTNDDLIFGRVEPRAIFNTYERAKQYVVQHSPVERTEDFKLRIRKIVTGKEPFTV